MALVQWKQISSELTDKIYTGSLNITGSIHLNGIDLSTINQGIFTQTGSYWNTSRNIGITGSFQLNLDGVSDYFSVVSNGREVIKVTEQGTLQLISQSVTPFPIEGGVFYSASNSFYLGFRT